MFATYSLNYVEQLRRTPEGPQKLVHVLVTSEETGDMFSIFGVFQNMGEDNFGGTSQLNSWFPKYVQYMFQAFDFLRGGA